MIVGLDLGDKRSHFCALDSDGRVVERGRVRTTDEGIRNHFGGVGPWLVAIEVGSHAWWLEKLLLDLGHEVVVANTRKVRAIWQNDKKSDKTDAELLARLARSDRGLLCPVKMRGRRAQTDLMMLKMRDSLVCARTGLVNAVRGTMKSFGVVLPSCSADAFAKKVRGAVPEEHRDSVLPVLDSIGTMTQTIREYEKKLEAMARDRYPQAQLLQEVTGVGLLTSLGFVLTIDDPARFRDNRDVGAYLGLTPRRDQSGGSDPQLGITKAGNGFMRRLLVGAAQYIMCHESAESELRQWAWKLAGGPECTDRKRKKRAVVALARKLAVVMLSLWKSGSCYEPFPERAPAVKGAS
jgi:transposase